MATYTVNLTPEVVNQASEASLDTSVLNGLSRQRTKECLLVVNGQDRKQLHRLADGETYDDTTFETVVPNVAAGNPNFPAGTPSIMQNNVSAGHPTASSITGSTFLVTFVEEAFEEEPEAPPVVNPSEGGEE